MSRLALTAAAIFDGTRLHPDAAVLVDDARPEAVVALTEIPPDVPRLALEGVLSPGFVDLQVNGGGGVMLGAGATVEDVRRIAAAHRAMGTRALLPTLITDTPAATRAAIDAVAAAIAAQVPGVLGLHLEGPHLDPSRHGAHDPRLIRPMEDADEAVLLDAARRLPNLKVTLAPDAVAPDRIARLAQAGILVSLGHGDCTYESARAAIDAGARCVTHLFNAMSQMANRAPGLVGAALDDGRVSAGIIADGHHVHPASLRVARAAKAAPGGLFLVTDAMAPAGTDATDFRLGARRVLRADGCLRLEDGTLAGADLDMARAVAVMQSAGGADLSEALAMATSRPAGLLRAPGHAGRLIGAALDDLIVIDGKTGSARALPDPQAQHRAAPGHEGG
ncbi:N-acetylglucosamine 6-phosphate deacetylase [Palleronia salina]|uniref:N-acetylglucosamine 6-phosphate deacetylase n=1 Tax=Palleronia salina TaxID=313368 RepID=A0A1M6L799_9RHOB|nr:N-acetylglucosamine-6-phosphate deacetylase [Palleronia salina]SHJ67014.1 N-acetylglucosamine 6-phosphate deacetylase [Palleronia salina]